LIGLGVFVAAAALGLLLFMPGRPAAPTTAPTPVPIPSPVRSDRLVPSAEPAAVVPTPSPAPETYGAVYEVTIARPAPSPAETEPPPLDLRRIDPKDVTPPVLVQRVEPVYPEAARRARAEGQVLVEAVISDRGEVQDPRIVRPVANALLNDAALRAVSQWRYRPAIVRGKPVRVFVTVTVTFRLN
jgi:protein TonB